MTSCAFGNSTFFIAVTNLLLSFQGLRLIHFSLTIFNRGFFKKNCKFKVDFDYIRTIDCSSLPAMNCTYLITVHTESQRRTFHSGIIFYQIFILLLGRLYDSSGDLKDWWSSSSAKAFKEKANCIYNQYSALSSKSSYCPFCAGLDHL